MLVLVLVATTRPGLKDGWLSSWLSDLGEDCRRFGYFWACAMQLCPARSKILHIYNGLFHLPDNGPSLIYSSEDYSKDETMDTRRGETILKQTAQSRTTFGRRGCISDTMIP